MVFLFLAGAGHIPITACCADRHLDCGGVGATAILRVVANFAWLLCAISGPNLHDPHGFSDLTARPVRGERVDPAGVALHTDESPF